MRVTLLLGMIGVVGGCGYQGRPVTLMASSTEAVKLAGQWEGEYSGQDSRRHGYITFRISPRGDSALGDVQMSLPQTAEFPVPGDRLEQHLQHAPSMDFLSISLVAVAGGQVSGELEPYIAPDCECLVKTVFVGVLRGNTIEGIYVTFGEKQPGFQRGQWRVKRVKRFTP